MHFGKAAVIALGIVVSAGSMCAQGYATARQKYRLDAFGMGSYVRPDYGGALKNAGGTVGANLNFPGFGRFEPGLDARALFSVGRVSNQTAYLVGPRIVANYGSLHPYVHFDVGYGKISYKNPAVFNGVPYTQDNSMVYAYGGGLDYDLTRSFALRGDIMAQRWKVGQTDAPFHPLALSLGVRYRFHFSSKTSPGY